MHIITRHNFSEKITPKIPLVNSCTWSNIDDIIQYHNAWLCTQAFAKNSELGVAGRLRVYAEGD